jgi:hypothetical protein
VGNPNSDEARTCDIRWFGIEAHDWLHSTCSWIKDANELPPEVIENYHFMDPLPKGNYYSKFRIGLMTHLADEENSGYDIIELKIPFTVE